MGRAGWSLTCCRGADYTPGDVDKTVRDVLIETHYAKHRYFIDENRILDNAALLPSVPIRIRPRSPRPDLHPGRVLVPCTGRCRTLNW